MEFDGSGVAFEEHTEGFFSMLRVLMEEGKLKFASDGVFADGDIEAQLGVLRRAWPSTRDREDLDEDGFWFLTDAPFGLVWLAPEGDVWT